jgi:hypothetical protein
VLDTALAEGQLSMTEHGERVKAATHAATLGELQMLVSDLQTANAPVQLPDLRKPRARMPRGGAGWGLRLATAAVLVLFGIAVGWGLYGNTSSPLSFETDPGAKSDGVPARVLTPPRQLLSVGGLNGLFEQMRKKFGSTVGFDLDIRPDTAYLRLADPGDARRTLMYTYRGGWGDDPSESTTDDDARAVDLSRFDVEAVLGAMRGGPELVGVPQNEVKEVRLDIRPSKDPLTPGDVNLMVYVSGEFNNGHFTLTPDGQLKEFYKAS